MCSLLFLYLNPNFLDSRTPHSHPSLYNSLCPPQKTTFLQEKNGHSPMHSKGAIF